MGDSISRQVVAKFLDDWLFCLDENCHKQSASDLKMIIKDFKNLPSIQSERKTGHWIPVTNGRGGHQCDRCGSYAPSYQSGAEWLSNFCPECNADMRGDKHETD